MPKFIVLTYAEVESKRDENKRFHTEVKAGRTFIANPAAIAMVEDIYSDAGHRMYSNLYLIGQDNGIRIVESMQTVLEKLLEVNRG